MEYTDKDLDWMNVQIEETTKKVFELEDELSTLKAEHVSLQKVLNVNSLAVFILSIDIVLFVILKIII